MHTAVQHRQEIHWRGIKRIIQNRENPVGMESNAPPAAQQSTVTAENPVGMESNAPPAAQQSTVTAENPVSTASKPEWTKQQRSEVTSTNQTPGVTGMNQTPGVTGMNQTGQVEDPGSFLDIPTLTDLQAIICETAQSDGAKIRSVVKKAAASVTSLMSRASTNSPHDSSSSIEYSIDQCSRLGDEADDENDESGSKHNVNKNKLRRKHLTPRSTGSDSSDEDNDKPQQGSASPSMHSQVQQSTSIISNMLSPGDALSFDAREDDVSLFKEMKQINDTSVPSTPMSDEVTSCCCGPSNEINLSNSCRTSSQNLYHVFYVNGRNHEVQHDTLQETRVSDILNRSSECSQQTGYQTHRGDESLQTSDQGCIEVTKEQNSLCEKPEHCVDVNSEDCHFHSENTPRTKNQGKNAALIKNGVANSATTFSIEVCSRRDIFDKLQPCLIINTLKRMMPKTRDDETQHNVHVTGENKETFDKHKSCVCQYGEKLHDLEKTDDSECMLLPTLHDAKTAKNDHIHGGCYCSDVDNFKMQSREIIQHKNVSSTENDTKCAMNRRVNFSEPIYSTSTCIPATRGMNSTKSLSKKCSLHIKSIIKNHVVRPNPEIFSVRTNTMQCKHSQCAVKHTVSASCSCNERKEQNNSFSSNFKGSHCMTGNNENALYTCFFHRKPSDVNEPSRHLNDELPECAQSYLYGIQLDRRRINLMARMSSIGWKHRAKFVHSNIFHRVTSTRPLLKPLSCPNSVKGRDRTNGAQDTDTEPHGHFLDFSSSHSETENLDHDAVPVPVFPTICFKNLKRYKVGSLTKSMSHHKKVSIPSMTKDFNLPSKTMSLCVVQIKPPSNKPKSNSTQVKCKHQEYINLYSQSKYTTILREVTKAKQNDAGLNLAHKVETQSHATNRTMESHGCCEESDVQYQQVLKDEQPDVVKGFVTPLSEQEEAVDQKWNASLDRRGSNQSNDWKSDIPMGNAQPHVKPTCGSKHHSDSEQPQNRVGLLPVPCDSGISDISQVMIVENNISRRTENTYTQYERKPRNQNQLAGHTDKYSRTRVLGHKNDGLNRKCVKKKIVSKNDQGCSTRPIESNEQSNFEEKNQCMADVGSRFDSAGRTAQETSDSQLISDCPSLGPAALKVTSSNTGAVEAPPETIFPDTAGQKDSQLNLAKDTAAQSSHEEKVSLKGMKRSKCKFTSTTPSKVNRRSTKCSKHLPPINLSKKTSQSLALVKCRSKHLIQTDFQDTFLTVTPLTAKTEKENCKRNESIYAFGSLFKPDKTIRAKQCDGKMLHQNLQKKKKTETSKKPDGRIFSQNQLIEWEKHVLEDGTTWYTPTDDTDQSKTEVAGTDGISAASHSERNVQDHVPVPQAEDIRAPFSTVSVAQRLCEDHKGLEMDHGTDMISSFSSHLSGYTLAEVSSFNDWFDVSVNTDTRSTCNERQVEHLVTKLSVQEQDSADSAFETTGSTNTSLAKNLMDEITSANDSAFNPPTESQERNKLIADGSTAKHVICRQLSDTIPTPELQYGSFARSDCVSNQAYRSYRRTILPILRCQHLKESQVNSSVNYSKTQKQNPPGHNEESAGGQPKVSSNEVNIHMLPPSSFPSKVIQSWDQSARHVRTFVQLDPRRVLSTSNIHRKMAMQKCFVQKVPLCIMEQTIRPTQINCEIQIDEKVAFPGEICCNSSVQSKKYSDGEVTDGQAVPDIPGNADSSVMWHLADRVENSTDHLYRNGQENEEARHSSDTVRKCEDSESCNGQDGFLTSDPFAFDDDDLFAEFEEFPDFRDFSDSEANLYRPNIGESRPVGKIETK